MDIKLTLYADEKETALDLIWKFWKAHNGSEVSNTDVSDDLNFWTSAGHKLYFIEFETMKIGFIHLGCRGAEIDWLENIFVLPEYQGKGIGSAAISLIEKIVKQYSESLYIEAAARNAAAIHLYRKLGYDCLNTITIRKDFETKRMECIHEEKINGEIFQIRRYRK